MTVLEKRVASGVETKRFRSHLVVAAVAVVVGVGSAWVFNELVIDDTSSSVLAEQTTDVRSSAIGEHLDAVWRSGLAQQAAIQEAELLDARVAAGLAQRSAITATAIPTLDSLQESAYALAASRGMYASTNSASLLESAGAVAATRGIPVETHLESLLDSAAALAVVRGGD